MQRETIELEHGSLEMFIDGSFMYLNIFGEYTGKDAISVTKYLENLFDEIGDPAIRVWNTTNLPEDRFELITPNINILFEWSCRRRMERPDDVVYVINDNTIKDGKSGMYEPKAFFNDFSITVVKSIDELPENIKERIYAFKA